MIQPPAIKRTTAVWAYRSLWLIAVLLALAMPAMILVRGDVWVGPVSFSAANRPDHSLIVVDGNVSLQEGMDFPLVVILGDVQIDGPMHDVLVAVGGNVYLGQHAVLEDAVVVLGGQVFRAPGAVTRGTVGANVRDWSNGQIVGRPIQQVDLVRQVQLGLAAGLGLLLVCLVVVAVVPWSIIVSSATARRYPIRSGLAGLTGLLAASFVLLPLTLSLIGLPLAMLLSLGTIVVWLVGLTSIGFMVGQRLLGGRQERTAFLRVLIVGLTPILLVLAVPVLGPLAVGAVGVLGAGARIVSFVERERADEAVATVVRAEF